jgi:threonine aldolase
MRKAMAEAEVGDDVFSEDPTARALEEEVAALLGKEAALYAPSGCMANQLALNVQATEGDEVILEADAHIFNYETTAASFLSRVQLNPVKAKARGVLDVEDVRPAVREKAYYMPMTRIIAIENTHNRAGGTVYPIENVIRISEFAHANGILMHLDGARLWNACAATGLAPIEYAKHFDTVSICFSKGLGAPVGSAICGSKENIGKARRMRKIWGGGMRQAGIIAAGALYALRNNRERIGEDHAKARRFAEIIANDSKSLYVDLDTVQTNIVLFGHPTITADEIIARMQEHGIRLSQGAHGLVRAIAHLDVTMDDCERAARTLVETFG